MEERRIRRRRLLAASVAAGTVWTAPALVAVSPAAAAILSHPADQCPVVRPSPSPTRGSNTFGTIDFLASVETLGSSDPVDELRVAVGWEHSAEYLFERRVLCCGSTSHADAPVWEQVHGGPTTSHAATTSFAGITDCGLAPLEVIVRHVLVDLNQSDMAVGSAVFDVLAEVDSGNRITILGASNPVSTFLWLVFPLAP